jgi:hypothetical protein
MGALVSDPHVPNIQNKLNNRFAPGDPIKEMAAVQREFDVFNLGHSLKSIAKLLNLAPEEHRQRIGWYKFLDHLKQVPTDKKMSGHDLVIVSIKNNLEAKDPLPVWFTWRPGTKLSVIGSRQALEFSKTRYMIIAVPIRAA